MSEAAAANDTQKMPLLEHLVELRTRLVRSFIAIILLFFVCYAFAENIYGFLVQPLADVDQHQCGGVSGESGFVIENGGIPRPGVSARKKSAYWREKAHFCVFWHELAGI